MEFVFIALLKYSLSICSKLCSSISVQFCRSSSKYQWPRGSDQCLGANGKLAQPPGEHVSCMSMSYGYSTQFRALLLTLRASDSQTPPQYCYFLPKAEIVCKIFAPIGIRTQDHRHANWRTNVTQQGLPGNVNTTHQSFILYQGFNKYYI